MTDLNGEWRGSGSDRNLPIESFQSTTCRTTINADLRNMTTEMVCDGASGAHKVVLLKASLNGNKLTGTVSQTITAPGSAPSVLNGTMSGHRTGDTASFFVHWSGWQPNTTVTLRLTNPSSFTMHVSSLGIAMLDVVFTRTGKH